MKGDPGSIPVSGRFPGEENGYPVRYSCLRNPWTEETGRSVESQSWTQLSDEHFHFHELTTDLD